MSEQSKVTDSPEPAAAAGLHEVAGEDPALAEALAMGVEPEGVDAGPLLKAMLVLALMVAAAVVIVFQWRKLVYQETMVEAIEASGYPALREYRAASAAKLSQYEVIDAGAGVYRIPIERAMEVVVRETGTRTGTYTAEVKLLPTP
ncbi:MAG: hypothetical protein D6746_08455 [Bacteroidetes bacterium]|nr:MAG: hypothetical protein D6746_08455 [Bacteroidota bacterium]